ncbi:hypothetical protein PUR25_00020, partial [Streptomyces sp. JV181]|nr:hypothetical protein [Streptomyces sp. JV181]
MRPAASAGPVPQDAPQCPGAVTAAGALRHRAGAGPPPRHGSSALTGVGPPPGESTTRMPSTA